MTGHVAVHCKPGTARGVRNILDKHVLPEFGRLRLGEVTPGRVATGCTRRPSWRTRPSASASAFAIAPSLRAAARPVT